MLALAALVTLVGSVGPGFTISLKHGVVHPGRYAIVVHDRSPLHDFRLKGPGVNRVIGGVGFTGTARLVVRLRAGRYTFLCDPHPDVMRGSFRVR